MTANLILTGLLAAPLVTAAFCFYAVRTDKADAARAGMLAFPPAYGILALAGVSASSRSAGELCALVMPDTGAMCVELDANALKLIACLSAALFFMLSQYYPRRKASDCRPVLAILSLSAGSAALLSRHFLLRYIALEFVGLLFLINLFMPNAGRKPGVQQGVTAFVNLKLGDAGLLAAIFLMLALSGHFEIAANLELAAGMPPNRLLVTAGALVLAAWVKMGAWPLNWWMRVNAAMQPVPGYWLGSLLLPVLGTYLLFRAGPLVSLAPGLPGWVFAACSASACITVMLMFFRTDREMYSWQHTAFEAALLGALAASGLSGDILPWLVLLVGIRLGFFMLADRTGKGKLKTGRGRLIIPMALPVMAAATYCLMVARIQTGIWFALWTPLLWTGVWLAALQFIRQAWMQMKVVEKNKVRNQPLAPVMGASAGGLLGISGAIVGTLGTRAWIAGQGMNNPVIPAAFRQLISWQALSGILIAFIIERALALIGNHLPVHLPADPAGQQRTSKEKRHAADEKPAPRDLFDQFAFISKAIHNTFRFLHQRVEQFFNEGLWKGTMTGVLGLATFLYHRVEMATSEKLWQYLVDQVLKAARRLQRLHTGRLRFNLVWLLIILIALVWLVASGRLILIGGSG